MLLESLKNTQNISSSTLFLNDSHFKNKEYLNKLSNDKEASKGNKKRPKYCSNMTAVNKKFKSLRMVEL